MFDAEVGIQGSWLHYVYATAPVSVRRMLGKAHLSVFVEAGSLFN